MPVSRARGGNQRVYVAFVEVRSQQRRQGAGDPVPVFRKAALQVGYGRPFDLQVGIAPGRERWLESCKLGRALMVQVSVGEIDGGEFALLVTLTGAPLCRAA